MSENTKDIIEKKLKGMGNYQKGFTSDIDSEKAPKKGLSEDIIKFISAKKEEPKELLEFRLNAYRKWDKLKKEGKEPHWAEFKYPPINYDDIYYYVSPKNADTPKSLDEVDPKIIETYNRLGISLKEQELLAGIKKDDEGKTPVAIDAVIDSTSVATTYKDQLKALGIIFCSFGEAVRDYWPLIKEYLGTVVPANDSFYSYLNGAAFSDGTFVYIPKGVKCPIELGSYFRINASEAGQFERTLIVADEGSYVSYLEGCSAPQRDENQLHVAVVEIVALKDAEVKYSTVQNWYPGDKDGKGGIYNFVTKRGLAKENAKISWTQLEVGSALTWKYPSCILEGDNSVGEFFSVAITNNHQKADTGTKMIHLGKNTKSTIISKGVAAGHSENTYRGLVKIGKDAENARNYTRCDSLIIGEDASSHTFPDMQDRRGDGLIEHEASTSKISEDQLFFLNSRGIDEEKAVSMIVNGFASNIVKKLPSEFAMEAKELINISLED